MFSCFILLCFCDLIFSFNAPLQIQLLRTGKLFFYRLYVFVYVYICIYVLNLREKILHERPQTPFVGDVFAL